MKRKEGFIIAGTVFLIIALFIFAVFEIRDVPDLDWRSRYHFDKKEPHDLYVFKELLDEKYGEENIEIISTDTLLDHESSDQLYVTYGTRTAFTPDKLESLEAFLKNGNQVLMIGTEFDFYIELPNQDHTVTNESQSGKNEYSDEEDDYETDYSYDDDEESFDEYEDEFDEDEEEEYDDYEDDIYIDLSGQVSTFTDTLLQFDFVRFDSSENRYKFLCINRDLNATQFQKLRSFDEKYYLQPISYAYNTDETYSNPQTYFGKINTINGAFYVHTVPPLFQNLGTQQAYYLDHFNNTFSRFEASKVILEVVNPYTNLVRGIGGGGGGAGRNNIPDKESPISYIINTPPLAWAYYLLMLTMLLYAIFKGKRRQKIIPVIAENKNTSLDYINTLSILYQNQKQNSKLVKHIRDGFYHRIKNKYYIDQKDEDFVNKLAAKSKVDKTELRNLIHKLKSTHGGKFTDDQLIILHKQLETFYQKAE